MKQKIPNKIKDAWKQKKEREERLEFEMRKKLYDVYMIQLKDGYPSPIERGLFRSHYLCPVCNTELDTEPNDVGILVICSGCEYKYLDTKMYGLEALLRLLREFDKERKKEQNEKD